MSDPIESITPMPGEVMRWCFCFTAITLMLLGLAMGYAYLELHMEKLRHDEEARCLKMGVKP
jgi:hypothetical protein